MAGDGVGGASGRCFFSFHCAVDMYVCMYILLVMASIVIHVNSSNVNRKLKLIKSPYIMGF